MSDEEELVRQTAREFARNEIEPVALEYERSGTYPRDLIGEAAAVGLTAPSLPVEYGESGFGPVGRATIFDELHRADPGIAESITAATSGCGVITENGSEEQAGRYVEPAAFGRDCHGRRDDRTARGRTSRTSGRPPDARATSTSSTATKCSSPTVASPTRSSCTPGRAMSTPPHRGISAFVLNADYDGIDRTKMDIYLGPSTVDLGQRFLDEVRVPADALIGEEDEGFYYAMEMMDESRPEVAASAIGAARGAIDRATDYVRDRDAFDRNVVDYQSAHHRIADPETRLEAAKSLTYETAREMENGTLEGCRKL